MNTEDAILAETLLAKAAYEKKTPEKHSMQSSEFNATIKDAESAIICFDTDAFDLRQRMAPLLDNPQLNPEQQERVMVMRRKLMAVLIEHGFPDAWGTARK